MLIGYIRMHPLIRPPPCINMYLLLAAAAILALGNGVNSAIVGPRIIGGSKSNIESYPYMLSVRVFDTHQCGGAILSQKHFVTAARCLSTLPSLPYYYKVRVGSSSRDTGGKLIVVEKCVEHPNHQTFQHFYDVAIGTLQKPLDFLNDKKTIQPIALVKEEQVYRIGDMLTISGWGSTVGVKLPPKFTDEDAKTLQTLQVPYAHRDDCRVFQRANIVEPPVYTWVKVNSTLICAGGSGRTVFTYDAGNPLVNNKKELVGIATRHHDSVNLRWPGVYANLAHPSINKFIVDNIKIV